MGEKASRKGVPGRVRHETRSSAVIRATDFSLTHGECRIGSGSACRAKPVRGAASEMSPQPGAAPLPCGSAPLKLTGAARAPGAANVINPSEGVHAVSAQQCSFGRGVASGPQVSVALPALRPVAPPDALRLLWRIVLRGSGPKVPLNQSCGGVAILRPRWQNGRLLTVRLRGADEPARKSQLLHPLPAGSLIA
jgi:hypothetical protein